jgi:hypothetical protein
MRPHAHKTEANTDYTADNNDQVCSLRPSNGFRVADDPVSTIAMQDDVVSVRCKPGQPGDETLQQPAIQSDVVSARNKPPIDAKEESVNIRSKPTSKSDNIDGVVSIQSKAATKDVDEVVSIRLKPADNTLNLQARVAMTRSSL